MTSQLPLPSSFERPVVLSSPVAILMRLFTHAYVYRHMSSPRRVSIRIPLSILGHAALQSLSASLTLPCLTSYPPHQEDERREVHREAIEDELGLDNEQE
jgi:hypothetical protein